MSNSVTKKEVEIEHLFASLEDIVAQLEGGSLSLESALSSYAHASDLLQQCRSILDAAETRVQVLSEEQGSLSELDVPKSESL